MSVAFKRCYIDVPPDVWEKIGTLARERGTSRKALVESILTQACAASESQKPTTKRGKK